MTGSLVIRLRSILFALSGLALVVSGCGPSGDQTAGPVTEPPAPPRAPAPSPSAAQPSAAAPAPPATPDTAGTDAALDAARQEARTIFSTRCFTCHGKEGRGNGPASEGMNPQPRNFHDPAWQDSVTDEHLHRVILLGGTAVGKSPLMPPNPDLTNKPEVVTALAEIVRGFRGR